MEFITSGRFSKEDEEEDEEEASKHEISFIPTTATTSASPSTASAAASVSVSALASVAASTSATASVSTSALGGSPFRSRDDAGASGSGGGGGGGDTEVVEKEHMFDKVVTPSDVGKLNRLVIPKQHAEKYFPLDAAGSEKGLLLSFEDRTGKSWRFRYSYWNSSQSYVMTKGWSRFVKEKRLDAGDTVSFSRGSGEAARDRLFIDWRCRPDIRDPRRVPFLHLPIPVTPPYGQWGSDAGFFMRPAPPATLYEHRLRQGLSLRNMNSVSANVGRQLLFFGSAGIPPRAPPPPPSPPSPPLHTTVQSNTMVTAGVPVVLDSVPVINSQKTGAKRLRLFGVNLDSTHSDSESSRDVNALSLQMPGWQPSPPPLRLPALPPHGADCSAATSPSSSSSSKKEAHSSLDLDL